MLFRDQYAFLSNFAPVTIKLGGMTYPTVEHAYMAAKTLNPLERLMIQEAKTPAEAKKLGRKVTLRPDWDKIKLDVMEACLRSKFRQEPYRTKLLATGELELVEENTWGDHYWGMCNGVGQNRLGKLLMKIRAELKKG